MDDKMKDFLFFRKMITPVIIQILFWIGIVGVVIGGFVAMFTTGFLYGLAMVVLGPIAVRIWTELLIVLFKINDTLTDIKNNTTKE